jgi:urease accessory protein
MLKHLGADVIEVEAPFDPEGGAYHDHGPHDHGDHGHGEHGHGDHDHSHEHGHGPDHHHDR